MSKSPPPPPKSLSTSNPKVLFKVKKMMQKKLMTIRLKLQKSLPRKVPKFLLLEEKPTRLPKPMLTRRRKRKKVTARKTEKALRL